MRRHFITGLTYGVWQVCTTALSSALGQNIDRVIVSSKLDAEGVLLGNMIMLMLERVGVPTDNRLQLGPTRIVRTALVAGHIHIYPEYTGNGALFFQSENASVWKTSQSAYEGAKNLDQKNNGLVWLARAPANNAWAIAVRGDLARREQLTNLEDFARAAVKGTIRLAASAEFLESQAALPAFERAYEFQLPRNNIVIFPGGDTTPMMRAAAQNSNGVNAAVTYGTDGAISAFDLNIMADNRSAQNVYEPCPVVRADVLNRYQAIAPALAPVFSSLTTTRLQGLNARITIQGQAPRNVARWYLREEGFLP